MTNLVEVQYAQTGKSSNTDELGMREMQAMVYAQRHRQHLLVKAPPASGKSRAMMFVALDKLAHQGVKKVIVAVPQQNIGRSFKDTPLKKFGFFEGLVAARMGRSLLLEPLPQCRERELQEVDCPRISRSSHRY